MDNKEQLKWLVAGLGFISPRHIKSIKETGGEIVAVCDIDQKKSEQPFNFYNDYRVMIDDYTRWSSSWDTKQYNADAIAICTPNCLHFDMIQYALDNNLRVLCEKPLTLNSKEVLELPNDGRVGVVLQLRYHPGVINLKKDIENGYKPKNGKLVVKVIRDKEYWESWKGDKDKSGGILFNLGIHYFDLLIYLFGEKYEIVESSYTDKLAKGIIDFDGIIFSYYIEIQDDKNGQDRRLELDGEVLRLSKKDNLSFEGLHTEVYKAFNRGEVVTPKEASKSIKLIEQLCLHVQQL
ncbi:MAG: Gfo/Idh/MocA family protein [Candidatus Hodarchaeota archaeon]